MSTTPSLETLAAKVAALKEITERLDWDLRAECAIADALVAIHPDLPTVRAAILRSVEATIADVLATPYDGAERLVEVLQGRLQQHEAVLARRGSASRPGRTGRFRP